MKITNYPLLTAAVVATILVTIVQAAPLRSLTSFRKADFSALHDCVYKRWHNPKTDSFCHGLLNPNHTSGDNLTPSQVSLRYIFYTESALLWRLYNKWSDCRMRSWSNDNVCLEESDYAEGFFLKNFRSSMYALANRFDYFIWIMSPLKTKVNHCMHFHASNSNPLLPRYGKCSDVYSALNKDNVIQTFKRLNSHLKKQFWVSEKVSENAQRSNESLDKEAFYDCLYSPSVRDSDAQKSFCRYFVNTELTARASNFSYSSGVSLQGLNQTGQHYVEFVRSSLVYDCLKYHRTEQVSLCEDVFKHVGCTWAKDRAHHDPIVEMIVQLIKEEEDYEDLRLARYADTMMPTFNLPKRLTKLCELYSITGKKVTQARPEDCEKDGLYYPFL